MLRSLSLQSAESKITFPPGYGLG